MVKTKTKKQVRFLFSKGSPLSKKEKGKLENELHDKKVKIKGKKKKSKKK